MSSLHGRLAALQFFLAVAQTSGLFEALGLDGLFLLALHFGDLVFDLFEVGRGLHALDAQARAGLVDEVDGLVGQVAIGDVTVGQIGRRHQRLIGDRHPMVLFVAIAQTLEDLDGVRHRRLFDLDRLEAPLECGVFLEVLAVLVERRRADGLQFTASEHRLEDRRRVDGAFGRTGTDERVQLVDEDDDVAAGADLFEHLLEALFEIAAITRTGDQRAQIERVDLLALDGLGDIAAGNGLREAFDDGGLADTRLADEHRIVLGAPRQHLHDPLGLALATDDRIELLVAGELREVAAELVEDERTRRRLGAGATRSSASFVAGSQRRTRTRTGESGKQLDDLLADA